MTHTQANAAKQILKWTRKRITVSSFNNKRSEFAIRRYVRIRLEHDERGTPAQRRALKRSQFERQKKCPLCRRRMRLKSELHLHRRVAWLGYTVRNTVLVHAQCHRRQQRKKNFGP